jgi:hypothetical protein
VEPGRSRCKYFTRLSAGILIRQRENLSFIKNSSCSSIFFLLCWIQIWPVEQIQHGIPVAAHIQDSARGICRNGVANKLNTEEKSANKFEMVSQDLITANESDEVNAIDKRFALQVVLWMRVLLLFVGPQHVACDLLEQEGE